MTKQEATKAQRHCDGSGPHTAGTVRKIPYGSSGGNMILCRSCYGNELRYRVERMRQGHKETVASWESFDVYETE